MTPIKQGAAVLHNTINPALILAHARAWVGTPFLARADVRGVGADCIGLIRGLNFELTGKRIAAPPWRSDWATGSRNPLFDGLAFYADRIPVAEARPGHIVTYRVGTTRAAHVAILAPGGIIHAWETGGVKETQGLYGRKITSAWALPCAPGCARGPENLIAADCVAIVQSEGRRVWAEIRNMMDCELLATTNSFTSFAAAVDALGPIYDHIETVG